MGNGIYDYAISTAAVTGAANTDATLLSRSIAAGGMPRLCVASTMPGWTEFTRIRSGA